MVQVLFALHKVGACVYLGFKKVTLDGFTFSAAQHLQGVGLVRRLSTTAHVSETNKGKVMESVSS